MKDEEMAEEYEEKAEYIEIDDYGHKVYGSIDIEKAFLAGLKEGRLQWHDLRKDPQDLPKGHKVVLNQVGMATQYDPNRGFLGFGGAGIIAWCEIPHF